MKSKIRKIDGSTCNCYLINTGHRNVLIDFGRYNVMKNFLENTHVDYVLLTHCHRENSSDLFQFQSDVIAYGTEYELLSDISNYWNKLWGRKYDELGTPYVRPPVQPPMGKVLDGGTLDISPFIPVATPGHSPGHTSYLFDENGVRYAFIGGLMYSGNKIPNLYDCEWDYGYMQGLFTTVNSLRTLANYEPDVLLPDKGLSIKNGTKALLEFADRLEKFANFLLRDYDPFNEPPIDCGLKTKPTSVEGIDEISPHLLRVKAGYSNMYIILCDNQEAFMVDCGAAAICGGKDEAGFAKNMNALAREYKIKAFKTVLLTHYHGDHLSSYNMMQRIFGTEIWVFENMVDVIENPRKYKYPALLPWYGRRTSSLYESGDGTQQFSDDNDDIIMPDVKVNRILFDQEKIEIGQYQINVFHLPGQTNMGCGFSTIIDGIHVAFTGDNFYYTPEEGHNGHDCFVVANCALPENEGYLKCARVLMELKPQRVLCGHSFIIDNPMPQIESLGKFAEKLIIMLKDFLPGEQYEWYADPYWATPISTAHPAKPGEALHLFVDLRNHSDVQNRFCGKICLSEGFFCTNKEFDVIIPARKSLRLGFLVRVDKSVCAGRYPITVDIIREGLDYGQLFDSVILVEHAM